MQRGGDQGVDGLAPLQPFRALDRHAPSLSSTGRPRRRDRPPAAPPRRCRPWAADRRTRPRSAGRKPPATALGIEGRSVREHRRHDRFACRAGGRQAHEDRAAAHLALGRESGGVVGSDDEAQEALVAPLARGDLADLVPGQRRAHGAAIETPARRSAVRSHGPREARPDQREATAWTTNTPLRASR